MEFNRQYTKVTIQPYITDNINTKMYELKRTFNFTCEISFKPHVACEPKKELKIKSFFTKIIPGTNLAHCFEVESNIVFITEHVTFTNKELFQLLNSHFEACKEELLKVRLQMPNPEYYAIGLYIDYGSHIYHFVEDHKNNLDKWLSGTDCESITSQILDDL